MRAVSIMTRENIDLSKSLLQSFFFLLNPPTELILVFY